MSKSLQVLTLTVSIALAVFYVFVWLAHDPRDNDFAAFYSGAVLWERNERAYDQAKVCQIQSQIPVKLCLPFFHPPVLLPLLSLASDDDYQRSYRRWIVGLLIVLVCCAIPLCQLTKSVVHSLTLIVFLPMLFGFLQGQDSLFVLFGLLCFAWLLRSGKDVLAGVCLSLTTLRPTLAIALGVPLFFANRRAFWSFFVAGLALTLYSLALVGPRGFQDLVTALLTGAQSDPTTRPDRMYSVTGALVWLGVDERWTWLLFIASSPAVTLLWVKQRLTISTFGAAIVIAVFASPHLHAHDLVFLIIPLLAWPSFAVLLASFGFMVSLNFRFSHFFVYCLMVGLVTTLRLMQFRTNADEIDQRI